MKGTQEVAWASLTAEDFHLGKPMFSLHSSDFHVLWLSHIPFNFHLEDKAFKSGTATLGNSH